MSSLIYGIKGRKQESHCLRQAFYKNCGAHQYMMATPPLYKDSHRGCNDNHTKDGTAWPCLCSAGDHQLDFLVGRILRETASFFRWWFLNAPGRRKKRAFKTHTQKHTTPCGSARSLAPLKNHGPRSQKKSSTVCIPFPYHTPPSRRRGQNSKLQKKSVVSPFAGTHSHTTTAYFRTKAADDAPPSRSILLATSHPTPPPLPRSSDPPAA